MARCLWIVRITRDKAFSFWAEVQLCSTLLFSTLLFSSLLYSTVLYCTLLYSTVLYSIVLFFSSIAVDIVIVAAAASLLVVAICCCCCIVFAFIVAIVIDVVIDVYFAAVIGSIKTFILQATRRLKLQITSLVQQIIFIWLEGT